MAGAGAGTGALAGAGTGALAGAGVGALAGAGVGALGALAGALAWPLPDAGLAAEVLD